MANEWQFWVKGQIDQYRPQLQDEFGNFTTIEKADSHEVYLVPEEAANKHEWFRCYPSHFGADARLVVDDYCPEFGDEPQEGISV